MIFSVTGIGFFLDYQVFLAQAKKLVFWKSKENLFCFKK
jgi:hypothetical protein